MLVDEYHAMIRKLGGVHSGLVSCAYDYDYILCIDVPYRLFVLCILLIVNDT